MVAGAGIVVVVVVVWIVVVVVVGIVVVVVVVVWIVVVVVVGMVVVVVVVGMVVVVVVVGMVVVVVVVGMVVVVVVVGMVVVVVVVGMVVVVVVVEMLVVVAGGASVCKRFNAVNPSGFVAQVFSTMLPAVHWSETAVIGPEKLRVAEHPLGLAINLPVKSPAGLGSTTPSSLPVMVPVVPFGVLKVPATVYVKSPSTAWSPAASVASGSSG